MAYITGDSSWSKRCAGCGETKSGDQFPLGQIVIAKRPLCIRCSQEGRKPQSRHPKHRGRSISLGLRFTILKRDNYHCRLCGRGAEDGVKLEVDHRRAWSHGGADTHDNLWTLCFDCNHGKRDQEV